MCPRAFMADTNHYSLDAHARIILNKWSSSSFITVSLELSGNSSKHSAEDRRPIGCVSLDL